MTSETRTSLHIYYTWYLNSIIYSIIATYLVLHEKKEQFGKYQKPDLHIIIQCYMFYIREWMTKMKKMVCGKIEYVLIIFFCNFADRFCGRCWKWIEIILKNAFYQNNNTFWIHNSNYWNVIYVDHTDNKLTNIMFLIQMDC